MCHLVKLSLALHHLVTWGAVLSCRGSAAPFLPPRYSSLLCNVVLLVPVLSNDETLSFTPGWVFTPSISSQAALLSPGPDSSDSGGAGPVITQSLRRLRPSESGPRTDLPWASEGLFPSSPNKNRQNPLLMTAEPAACYTVMDGLHSSTKDLAHLIACQANTLLNYLHNC